MEMNKGLNWQKELSERSDEDYKHIGGVSPISIFAIPKELREQYLPDGELQNIGAEKMDCVSRAVSNWEESELTYAYRNGLLTPEQKTFLEKNRYVNLYKKVVLADAFIAILSGTTIEGNSLKAPIHARYKGGNVPKSRLPQLNTFDEHHNPERITDELRKLGEEYNRLFPIRYEQISEAQFAENDDDAIVAVYAWTEPVNGVYPRTDLGPNHCVRRYVKVVNHAIFDNYAVAGVFIKHLAPDFNFMDYGYRLYFVKPEPIVKKTFAEKLKAWLNQWNIFKIWQIG